MASTGVAGPGFINITLTDDTLARWSEKAAAELLEQLGSGNASKRSTACDLLGRLGPVTDEVVPSLIGALR